MCVGIRFKRSIQILKFRYKLIILHIIIMTFHTSYQRNYYIKRSSTLETTKQHVQFTHVRFLLHPLVSRNPLPHDRAVLLDNPIIFDEIIIVLGLTLCYYNLF